MALSVYSISSGVQDRQITPDLLSGDDARTAFMIVDGVQMKENRLYYI